MPSPTSPRNPLTRARSFHVQAKALPGTEREAFDNYLMAAIVFGRSVYHYLQSLAEAAGADEAYRRWFRAKSTEMEADPVLEYFRASRDLLLKERQVAATRRTSLTLTGSVSFHSYLESPVTRGQPWYRRSLRILSQDAKAAVMRPVPRLLARFTETVIRRGQAMGDRSATWRTRWPNRKVVPTVHEFYLDDPEGLDRPALELVRTYLDRLEAIVTDAEAQFGAVVS